MASEKQIQANRINALKGGVKTRAGKAKVRLNAVSHGFFSKDLLLPGEDQRLMTEFRETLTNEAKPQGEIETLLVELIISGSWRLKRILSSERKNTRINTDYRYSNHEKLMRYLTTLEHQIYKAVHELQKLQAARLEAESTALKDVSSLLPEENKT